MDINELNKIPGLTTSTSGTGTDDKSYTTCYPQGESYGQYCFNRLPCGICTRTNQMCPLVSNSQPSTPFIYCNNTLNTKL